MITLTLISAFLNIFCCFQSRWFQNQWIEALNAFFIILFRSIFSIIFKVLQKCHFDVHTSQAILFILNFFLDTAIFIIIKHALLIFSLSLFHPMCISGLNLLRGLKLFSIASSILSQNIIFLFKGNLDERVGNI